MPKKKQYMVVIEDEQYSLHAELPAANLQVKKLRSEHVKGEIVIYEVREVGRFEEAAEIV